MSLDGMADRPGDRNAWVRGSRDPVRDELMATLRRYAAEA
jgi:hypothetical protein